MMDHRRIKYIAVLLLLMSHSVLAAGETVYVLDELRLGIRPQPNSSEAPVQVVTTGAALEVLEEQGSYLRVRSEEGTEGWVSRSYTSSEPPARLRLAQLQQQFDSLQAERDALAKSIAAADAAQLQLQGEHATLLQENRALQQQVASSRAEPQGVLQRYRLPLQALLLVMVFAAGMILGIRWDKRRVASRIGGLEI